MKIGFSCCLCILLLASTGAKAEREFFFSSTADAFAAPVSVHAFTDDWHDKLRPGHIAFLNASFESGVREDQSTLSLVHRYDYLLQFNDDSARIYYQYKNNLPPDVGKNYPLYIRIRDVESRGVRYAYTFQSADSTAWQFDLGLSLLQGLDITDGDLQGNALFLSPKSDITSVQSLIANIDYHYSTPALHEQRLGWHPDAPEGYGYSVDLALRARLSESLHFSLSVQNALGLMYWQQVPTTHYVITCQCYIGRYSTGGQLQYDDRFHQTLPLLAQAQLRYDLDPHWYLVGGALYNPLVTFGSAGAGYRRGPWQTQLSVEPQTHSLELRLDHRYFGLRWQADTLNFNKAHRLGADIYALYRW